MLAGGDTYTSCLHEEDQLPRLAGYTAPLSLRVFLRRYWNVALLQTEEENADKMMMMGSLRNNAARTINAPACATFHAVFVYVSVDAPPPPPLLPLAGERQPAANEGSGEMPPTPPPPRLCPQFAGIQNHPERSDGKLLSSGVLHTPFMVTLFESMGPAFAAFVMAHCPMVVQMTPVCGSVHVAGPSVARHLSEAVRFRNIGVSYRPSNPHPDRQRKKNRPDHLHSSFSSGTTGVSAGNRVAVSQLFQRDLRRDGLLLSLQRASDKASTTSGVTMTDLFLLRHPLKAAAAAAKTSSTSAQQRQQDDGSSPAQAYRIAEASAGSIVERVFASHLQLERRKKRKPSEGASTAEPSRNERIATAATTANSIPDTPQPSAGDCAKTRLTTLTSDFLQTLLRVNLRGVALKHFGQLEAKARRQCGGDDSRASTATLVSGLLVSHQAVVDFIAHVLGRLEVRKTAAELKRDDHITIKEDPLFPSVVGSSGCKKFRFFGTMKNVNAIAEAAGVWISAGKRGLFKASNTLKNVQVSEMPHFSGLCGGARRSQTLQRIFCEFQIFFFEEVLPLLITSTFHVTWTPKQQQAFCFIPKGVWDIVRRHEVLLLRSTSDTCALEYASAQEVWRKTNASPLGTSVIYAAVRFLPDGKKLRPIATIRCATGGSLAAMAKNQSKRKRADAASENAENVDAAAKARLPRASRFSSTPNSTTLRKALFCLVAGVEEKRRLLGAPKLSNRSHRDEYSQIAAFIATARNALQAQCSPNPQRSDNDQDTITGALSQAPPMVLSFIRADGQRCYDRLPQTAVVDAISRLVSHETYYRVRFRAALRTSAGKRVSSLAATAVGGDQQATTAAAARLVQRMWFATVSKGDYDAGFLPEVPQGWIVEETQVDEELAGAHIKEILFSHVRNHLVSVGGKLFVQRVGITQGSSVAMLLCDELLQRVDNDLVATLSEHEEPSLLLRRVDDVLVGTLSAVAADRCSQQFADGWDDVGFVSNASKMLRCQTETLTTSGAQAADKDDEEACVMVPWCGILLNSRSLECSIDWGRFSRYDVVRSLFTARASELEVTLGSIRLVRMLWMRAPLTVFCGTINSRRRVMQTVLECSGVWAHCLITLVVANAGAIRPHPRILLRSLNLAKGSLSSHIRRMGEQLYSVQQQNRSTTMGANAVPLSDHDLEVALWTMLQRHLAARFEELLAAGHPKRFLCLLIAVAHRRVREIAPLPNWPRSAAHLCQHDVMKDAQLAIVPVQHFAVCEK